VTEQDILESVLTREGWPTYSLHPNDGGGPTKGGITLRTLESWRGRRCTRAELKRLKKEEALAILKRRYVETNGINRVDHMGLRSQLIDDAVLSGPMLAVKDLQAALDTVTVDGIIGPETLAAVERDMPEVVGRRLAVERTIRLVRFVKSKPDQMVFLVGWVRRCLSFVT